MDSRQFMRAVETNSDWYLFCPNDIKIAGLKPFMKFMTDDMRESRRTRHWY
jgi:hypothetical protein